MAKPGQLRRRITIQQKVNTPGSQGDFIGAPQWQTVPGCGSVPCSIKYATPRRSGDEVYKLQQVQESLFATFVIRYRPSQNISPDMQVLYGNRTFNIRTVQTIDEYPQWIALQCEELQAKGSLH